MSLAEKLVRDSLKSLVPYQSARDTMAENDPSYLFLDAAENPYSPFDLNGSAPLDVEEHLNKYPNPEPTLPKHLLADKYQISPESLLITRGSEEAIRLLIQTFCQPTEDAILLCPPTFGLYQIEAALQQTEILSVPRQGNNFEKLQLDKITELAQEHKDRLKLCFLCSPGNPSSVPVQRLDILHLLDLLKDQTFVILDEAYIDFAEGESYLDLLNTYPNLIILRTLSKGYGLAGLRVGAILADPSVLDFVRRLTAVYPISRATAHLIERALTPEAQTYMTRAKDLIIQERDRMIEALSRHPKIQKIYPSQTNFLCIEVDHPQNFILHLEKHKIIVRDRSSAIPNAVSISLGTPDQNGAVLTALETY